MTSIKKLMEKRTAEVRQRISRPNAPRPLACMIRPGWRVAQIDRTRFYVTKDDGYEASARESRRTFRSREDAQHRVNELNAAAAAGA